MDVRFKHQFFGVNYYLRRGGEGVLSIRDYFVIFADIFY